MPDPIWKSKDEAGNKRASPVFDQPLKFRFRGTYDYDGLLNLIRNYYFKKHTEKLDEPKFKYKTKGGLAEVEFKMFGDIKVSGYTKIAMEVKAFMWNVQKGKQSNGRVQIEIQTFYLHDYAKQFNMKEKSKIRMKKLLQNEEYNEGIAFTDLDIEGYSNAESFGLGLLEEIKTFMGAECV